MNTPQVLPLSPMWSLYIGLLYRWMLIVALLLYRYGVYTVTKQAPNLSLCQLLQSAHCCFVFSTLLLSGFCHSHKFKTTMHHNGNNDRRFLCSFGHDGSQRLKMSRCHITAALWTRFRLAASSEAQQQCPAVIHLHCTWIQHAALQRRKWGGAEVCHN